MSSVESSPFKPPRLSKNESGSQSSFTVLLLYNRESIVFRVWTVWNESHPATKCLGISDWLPTSLQTGVGFSQQVETVCLVEGLKEADLPVRDPAQQLMRCVVNCTACACICACPFCSVTTLVCVSHTAVKWAELQACVAGRAVKISIDH